MFFSALKSIPTDDERTEALNKLQTEEKTLRENFSLAEQEIVRLRDEIKSKDEDQRALENVIDNFRQNALKEKENTKKLYDDLLDARQQDAAEISRLKQIEQIHKQTLADNADLRQLLEKEHQFIELTQTLTEKNSVLQSDLEMVRSQLHEKLEQTENLRRSNEQQKQNVVRLEKVETNLGQLVEQLEEKNRTLQRSNEEFLKKNEDLIVEMAALKKKHQANTKDLIKQLQQLQKSKISQHEDGNSPSRQVFFSRLELRSTFVLLFQSNEIDSEQRNADRKLAEPNFSNEFNRFVERKSKCELRFGGRTKRADRSDQQTRRRTRSHCEHHRRRSTETHRQIDKTTEIARPSQRKNRISQRSHPNSDARSTKQTKNHSILRHELRGFYVHVESV